MPRGGARPGAGRKPKPKIGHGSAARLIEALNRPASPDESEELKGWRLLWEAADLRIRLDVRKYLYDKRDGSAMQPTEVPGRDNGPARSISHACELPRAVTE